MNKTDTIPVPTHMNGRVVVAAIKLPRPTGEGWLEHQWVVVCEEQRPFALGTQFIVWHVGWDGGRYVANHGDYDISKYANAVDIMLNRAEVKA